MEKSFDYCNKCRKEDDSALIHCAVCAHPYHVKCVAPKLTIKACDDLVANNSFHFYCADHQNLCVHKLLNRIALLERKLRVCLEPLSDIRNELDKHQADLVKSGYSKSEPAVTQISKVIAPTPIPPENEVSEVLEPVTHESSTNVTLRRSNRKRQNDCGIIHTSPKRLRSSPSLVTSNVDHIPPFDQNERSPSENPPILKCITPQKAVFLSGFDPATSVDDIQVYIEYYARTRLKINIRKMKFNVQSRSAVFVINVGTDLDAFKLLCDPNFWPSHANCREYDFFRSRKRLQQDHNKIHLE